MYEYSTLEVKIFKKVNYVNYMFLNKNISKIIPLIIVSFLLMP